MADLRPFRAFRYDPQQVAVAQVVTQPYDKISPAMQDRYYAASPYNLVRIILGRRGENDDSGDNVYSRAAASFRAWREAGILRQDSQPSIYAYAQRFRLPGDHRELERRGFIAIGRIEDYSAKVVYRHEQTLAKPKADRLDLLRATRAHFGQLFMLYEDSGEIDSLLVSGAEPTTSVTDEYGVLHQLWQVSDSSVVEAVRARMKDKRLIIADGHHRYETAVNYRNERRAQASSGKTGGPDTPCEFVMMTLVSMNSPGLVILPTHRVVHSLQSFSAEEFRKSAGEYFEVREIDSALEAPAATALLHDAGRSGTGLLAVTPSRAFLLYKPKPAGSRFLAGLSPRQQSLDVVQLHKCVLEGVLKLSEDSIRDQQNLSYVRDAAEALAQVRAGSGPRADIAFLMNPCRVEQVRDIAFAGEVLPQKSTDFFPKLLSGLTIYVLD